MTKNSDLNLIVDLIKKEDRFVVLTHIQPDGDAFGSILGLTMLLKKIGKDVFLSIGKDIKIPPQYSFLPGMESLKPLDDYRNDFLNFIVLDCGSIERLGSWETFAKNAKNIINIDHHKSNTEFGSLNYIDEKSSSSSEMVYELGLALGVEIDKDIALCLYVGIVTDTGKFQYNNTTPNTLKNALKLLEYGILPNYVFENVYERATIGCLNLLGKVLNNAKFLEKEAFIYSYVSNSDLSNYCVGVEETENFVDFLKTLREARVAAILKETPDGAIKVSLRSKNTFSVDEIAIKFGGGGHRNAAGYTSHEDPDKTVELLRNAIREIGRLESERLRA